jgi:hypothetical protein
MKLRLYLKLQGQFGYENDRTHVNGCFSSQNYHPTDMWYSWLEKEGSRAGFR